MAWEYKIEKLSIGGIAAPNIDGLWDSDFNRLGN